jgi:predicted DCC family thiol-disulfide oxidoreductase YuxK
MPDDPRLTIFYDGACPLCAFEMAHLQRRPGAARLHCIYIAAPAFDPATHGFRASELDAVIHAKRSDGSVVRGMEVLRLAYGAAGIGWLLAPTRLPLLRPLFDAGYRLFARHRRAISSFLAPWLARARKP